jgi:hypothetical protein
MQNSPATIDQFTLADMQILMHVIEQVSISLNLGHGAKDMRHRSLISALVIECAEGGERDLKTLMDCAQKGFVAHLGAQGELVPALS